MSCPAQLPFEQRHPLQHPPQLRTLQSQGTVHRIRTAVGDEGWLVTKYAEVRRLLGDGRLGRALADGAARWEGRP